MVSVTGVHKTFAATPILRDITLQVEVGKILAIMGSSGGGKTTLLRCISGLIVPEQGTVLVDGVDVGQDPEGARRRMGMVFQSAALFDFMSVYDNVRFGVKRHLRLSESECHKKVTEALDRVGLSGSEQKMPSELSGGMRKRVGIARAISLSPRVMLYDEPTTGLDPVTTYTIDELIVSLSKELGMTSLLVSHDINSVMRTSERVAFLDGGQLVFDGSTSEFSQVSVPAIQEILQKSRATSLSGLH